MTDVFGAMHSNAYDLFYSEKDYPAECELLEQLFSEYSTVPVRSILDLCCGTGNHAIPLAHKGYDVTGVDRSPHMLRAAARKSEGLEHVRFIESDVRTVNLEASFDAVLMMFAALGYQTRDEDLRLAMSAVSRHLRPGGLFLFDVWYAPAVLYLKPDPRIRSFSVDGGELVRDTSAVLNEDQRTCTVYIRLSEHRKDGTSVETKEEHAMRFFYRDELEALVRREKMELLKLSCFPEISREPDNDSWNVIGVARRNSE